MNHRLRFFLVGIVSLLSPSVWLLGWEFFFDFFNLNVLSAATMFSALSLCGAKWLFKGSILIKHSANWFLVGCVMAFFLAVFLAAQD